MHSWWVVLNLYIIFELLLSWSLLSQGFSRFIQNYLIRFLQNPFFTVNSRFTKLVNISFTNLQSGSGISPLLHFTLFTLSVKN